MCQLALACLVLHATPCNGTDREIKELRWLKRRNWVYPTNPMQIVQHPFKNEEAQYYEITFEYPNALVS